MSVCSSAADSVSDTEQLLYGTVLSVTTTQGFGIDTSITGGEGFSLYSVDGQAFTDTFTSSITGEGTGIYALNNLSGALSISSNGVVTGTNQNGIHAENSSGGTDLTIDTVEVTGGASGMVVRNYGSGTLSIDSDGTVTGADNIGILALSRGSGSTINVADVTGGTYAIYAYSAGDNGLILTAASVTGGDRGIYAFNNGGGAQRITIRGAVSGAVNEGLRADNFSFASTDLILDTAEVTGATWGIYATSKGSGALSITSRGAVTGAGQTGILAQNAEGTDLLLTTADVTGAAYGIFARNLGSGALSVTSSGTVTGANRIGIFADNTREGTDMTLTTGDVTGAEDAISVEHNGSGALTITTNGVVTGDDGRALRLHRTVGLAASGTVDGTITNNGSLVSYGWAGVQLTAFINFDGEFNNNGDITGGNGIAFNARATTNGIVFNQNAGTLTGNVLLGTGNDVMTITGGTINGQIIGQGSGLVSVDVGVGNAFTSHGVVNVEDYSIQSGTVHQMGDFSTAAATTTIATGAALSFDSIINGAGALVSDGTLAFTPTGQLVQAGTVTLNAGSTISLDINGMRVDLNQATVLISATSIVDNGVQFNESFDTLLFSLDGLVTNTSVAYLATVNDLGEISPLINPSSFGDSITAFVNAGGYNPVVSLLANMPAGDVEGFEQVADVFSPSVSGAVSQGSREASDSTWRLINERIVGSETSDREHKQPNGLWMQGFGGKADQDSADHVEGFDADTGGVAVGYDRDMGQWRAGVAFSAGDTDVDNDRYAGDSIDIESAQFIAYGGFWQDQWYANATASVASLDYDFKRDNLVAGEGPIKGNSNGDLYGLSAGAGYDYALPNGVVVTPQLSLRYTSLEVDSYNEEGGLNLKVAYEDTDTLASELGVSVSMHYVVDDWQLAPSGRLAWVHEYLGDHEKATASYTGGPSYVQKGADPADDLAALGLGLEASNGRGLRISIDYSGRFGSDYSSNQGWLNLRYEF